MVHSQRPLMTSYSVTVLNPDLSTLLDEAVCAVCTCCCSMGGLFNDTFLCLPRQSPQSTAPLQQGWPWSLSWLDDTLEDPCSIRLSLHCFYVDVQLTFTTMQWALWLGCGLSPWGVCARGCSSVQLCGVLGPLRGAECKAIDRVSEVSGGINADLL